MKALRNNAAKEALKIINARRAEVDKLEHELAEHKAAATLALNDNGFNTVIMIAKKADFCQVKLRHQWVQIEKLRIEIDAGTTHMPAEGDFA